MSLHPEENTTERTIIISWNLFCIGMVSCMLIMAMFYALGMHVGISDVRREAYATCNAMGYAFPSEHDIIHCDDAGCGVINTTDNTGVIESHSIQNIEKQAR